MPPSITRASSFQDLSSLGDGISVETIPILNADGNIQFKHGPEGHEKTFVIKFIKQQFDKEETNIDLTYFTNYTGLNAQQKDQRGKELADLINGAKKAIDVMGALDGKPVDLVNARSFTLNFTQTYTTPSRLNHLLENLLNLKRWKFKPEPIFLETISYKETATSEEKKFTVNLERYDAVARKRIQEDLHPINTVIECGAHRSLEKPKPLKYKQAEQPPVETPPPGSSPDIDLVEEIPLKGPKDKSSQLLHRLSSSKR